MRVDRLALPALVWLVWLQPATAARLAKAAGAGCKTELVDGEVLAGQGFRHEIGGGLVVALQPIASGWILRVLPATGPLPAHDYAELATPPYRSVTPLSLSTDFSFRAQDAIGWNPRHFRFATSAAAFSRLEGVYARYEEASAMPPAPLEVELSHEIAQAAEGTLSVVDARLEPGTADQWKMAAMVASHFQTTAHTLAEPANGRPSALGRLQWVRFRIALELPGGFIPAAGAVLHTHSCESY